MVGVMQKEIVETGCTYCDEDVPLYGDGAENGTKSQPGNPDDGADVVITSSSQIAAQKDKRILVSLSGCTYLSRL